MWNIKDRPKPFLGFQWQPMRRQIKDGKTEFFSFRKKFQKMFWVFIYANGRTSLKNSKNEA